MKITAGSGAGSGSGAHAGATAPMPIKLIPENKLQKRVSELGNQINEYYAGISEPLILLIVMDGAMVFGSDLMRRISIPFQVETIKCKSYKDGTSSGKLKIIKDKARDKLLRQRQVLIVEDIIDSGLTIRSLLPTLPADASIRVVSLLERVDPRTMRDEVADWLGFKIPPGFVFGYGLDDADGTERGLKDVWVR